MIDRTKIKQQLEERSAESKMLGEKSGGGIPYVILPDGKSQWVPEVTKEGNEYLFDIVIYEVGDNYPSYPKLKRGGKPVSKLSKGKIAYCLNLFLHKGVGPNNSLVVCPYENYSLPCPICTKKTELLEQTTDKEARKAIYKKYGTTHRVLYNVIVRDGGPLEAKGVQLFDFSNFFMEEKLQSLKYDKRTGVEKYYGSPNEDGFSVFFKVTLTGEKKWLCEGYELVPRDYALTDKQLEDAIGLDSIVNVLPYEEIENLMVLPVHEETSSEDSDEQEQANYTPRQPMQKQTVGCPYKANFGVDFDAYEECSSCTVRVECEEAKPKPVRKKMAMPSIGDDVPF